MEALGVHTHWGLSPALDLTDVHKRAVASKPAAAETPEAPDSFLLVHCADPRHYLKTLSRRLRASKTPAEVFMWEPSAEAMVRSLALVGIALDFSMPVRQRAHMFLEVFGNVKVRDKTAKYLDALGKSIEELVCDKTGRLTAAVDPSQLSYRDVDGVAEAARMLSYRVPFDMETCWDHRLRHHYGERFDFRVNVIDWDFQEHVRPVAGLIHPLLFRAWRKTGLAFEFGDETYTQPNRTMASYALGRERGLSKLVRGYWGDVVASPYWATGTCVEVPPEADVGPAAHRAASSMFAVNNRHAGAEQFRHNAAEVAVLGILSLLTEIETAARYTMAKAHDIYSGLGGSRAAGSGAGPGGDDAGSPDEEAGPRTMDGAEVAPIGKKSASETAAEAAEGMTPREAAAAAVAALPMAPERSAERRRNALVARSVRRARAAASAIRSVRLVPLLGDIDRLLSHSRNRHRFSGAVIGCRSAQLLERPALAACLRPRAFVVQEAARNIVVFKQHQKDEFERRAVLMAGSLGLVFAGSDRTVAGTDKFAAGSVIDARPRAAKEADQRKREAALEEDKAAAAGAGDHAAGIMYLRGLAHWDERRGDNPRPEALVFEWDEAAAPARAEAIGKGPAGRAIREVMLQTQAELQAKEDAARRAAKAAAAGESGEAETAAAGPAAAAAQRPARAGAGAAWARGGAGSKVRRLKTEGGEAAASSQGAASGDEQGAAGGAAEPVAEAASGNGMGEDAGGAAATSLD
ncbi:hypothetical protein FNF29_01778 [Cafeteria roenbergensis]|uniref:Uncharacterized protein n=1 Tax=Cafeteria roenbergensis TaxID=33653 RepID=A0A5A8CQQ2_CAFRO|nr:hypothetical protein FNF29_01778 [Cafeteria roenbergensis]|eukprot:KAA0155403.1 hypothetical protein FNF29_01778 [Cafeteria roenbergensis]